MNRTPEEAKKLVAGPLGRQMEMFPLRYCRPDCLGATPLREHPVVVNNASKPICFRWEQDGAADVEIVDYH